MIVYIYTFPNGKRYIGQTIQTLNERASKGCGYQHSPLVYNAIQKYGWDNILKEIIECSSREEMDNLEKELIKKYNTTNKNFGYNLESGGNKNKKLSEETKKKISESLIGHYVSKETKNKISEAHKNKKLSEETKNKIKEAVSIANGQPVICLETKIIYPSVGIAAKEVGLKNGNNINAVCNGTRKTTGGYHWMYLSDYENLDKEI